MEDLKDDQKDVVAYVLDRVQKWMDVGNEYEPLRLTVCGEAGSGKSLMVQTLVAVLRTMFGTTDSVVVCGPTGSSAYCAGGRTIHSFFGLPMKSKFARLSDALRGRLMKKLAGTVALIVDERGMVSSEVLSVMENNARQTAHGGLGAECDWGGIPIVIFVGDDYQLPSIESGAFDAAPNLPLHLKPDDNVDAATILHRV